MRLLTSLLILFGYTTTITGQVWNWVSLPSSTNGEIKSVTTFQSNLVVGGHFTSAGTDPANSIAVWDGNTWSPLGSGLQLGASSGYVLKLITFGDSLIAVGNFDSAGTTLSRDIAIWYADAWIPCGSGTNGVVFDATVYNNELYIAGNFDTLDGSPCNSIAKWDGVNWVEIDNGARNGSGPAYVKNLSIYNGSLYLTGAIDSVGAIACENFAWWDGNSWYAYSPSLVTSNGAEMTVFQDTLFLYAGGVDMGGYLNQQLNYWNGTDMSIYTISSMGSTSTFEIFNGELYAGGGNFGYDTEYGCVVNKKVGTTWVNVGDGLSDFVKDLCVYNGDLYAAGSFNTGSGSNHNYLAKYSNVTSTLGSDQLTIKLWPQPASDKLVLSGLRDGLYTITLFTMDGSVILSEEHYISETENETIQISELKSGMYILVVMDKEGISYRHKIIKQ
ncbi:MAG: T9SS type A sorting domain-containing protein [Crocinitomicaceae bacterium]|nr:T9SS type A sorting domain-containing protein [Crocinitomicaceae bacterium]